MQKDEQREDVPRCEAARLSLSDGGWGEIHSETRPTAELQARHHALGGGDEEQWRSQDSARKFN